VKREAPFVFRITLVQGLNRQIRRMCEHFGFEVTKLERIRIMNVSLKGLPVGEWRDLTDDELIELFKLIEDSSSEAKPAKGLRLPSPRRLRPAPRPGKKRGAATITRLAGGPMCRVPRPSRRRARRQGRGEQRAASKGQQVKARPARASPPRANRGQGRAGARRRR
jgi:23S rRNA pseudouridine2604 synthase